MRAGPRDPYAGERFRTERQVLASLQHPNIAGLLDGGFAPDGTPFLVMELVDGVPITDWCGSRVSVSGGAPEVSSAWSATPFSMRTRPSWCTAISSRRTFSCRRPAP